MFALVGLLGRTIAEVAKDPQVIAFGVRGTKSQVDDRYHQIYTAAGIEFGANRDQVVGDIHLFTEGYQGFHGYQGQLPQGIDFSDSRKKVRRKLGPPAWAGGGPTGSIKIIKIPPMDTYDLDGYSL